MSLVGSLEDLGLGDILQIIGLSRKSGLLTLRFGGEEGLIVLRDGQVHGASLKGGPPDLLAVLTGAGALSGPEAEAVALRAARARLDVRQVALEDQPGLSAERIEELLRGVAEAAVVRMFQWTGGEFSFVARDDPGTEIDAGLHLASPLNAHYLAMEGTRAEDERRHQTELDPDLLEFGTVDDAPEPVLSTSELDAVHEELALPPDAGAEVADSSDEATLVCVTPMPTLSPLVASRDEPVRPPVVILDPELGVLEWAKVLLRAEFERVHVFQRLDLGLSRIRQYLSRGEVPVVILSQFLPVDPSTQRGGLAGLVERLRRQCPRIAILLLAGGSGGSDERRTTPWPEVDARIARPTRRLLDGGSSTLESISERLLELVRLASARASKASARQAIAAQLSPGELERLRAARALLRDPGSRGDVLEQVMRFAAERFSRVVLFQIRDEELLELARLGVTGEGERSNDSLPALRLPLRRSSWIRELLDRDAPIKAPPADAGDDELVALLGGGRPVEAYLAPIRCGDQTVAILYGDRHPSQGRIGDTTALEILLYEAELLLDRALLARTLERSAD